VIIKTNKMKNSHNTICIIPARAGSKGLKKKNILKINGELLIARQIRQASRSELWRKGKKIDDKVIIIEHKEDLSFIDIHSANDLKLANLILKNLK